MTHQILFYELVENMAERRAPFREEHLALMRAELDAGRLAMAGAFGDPIQGAVIVFHGTTDREAIEQFARSDPYVKAGLVTSWRIEPWNVVVSAEP